MAEMSKIQVAILRKRLRAGVDRKLAEFDKGSLIEGPTKQGAVDLALRCPAAFVAAAAKEYLSGENTPIRLVFERNKRWRAMKKAADKKWAARIKERNDYEAALMAEAERSLDQAVFCGGPSEALRAIIASEQGPE